MLLAAGFGSASPKGREREKPELSSLAIVEDDRTSTSFIKIEDYTEEEVEQGSTKDIDLSFLTNDRQSRLIFSLLKDAPFVK